MKKIYYLAFIAFGFYLCSCDNATKTPLNESTIGEDSIQVVDEQLKNDEVEKLAGIVNSIAACLDSIQMQEELLYKLDESSPKEQVVARLKSFQALLNRKQDQINKLTEQNKSNKKTMINLQKMAEFLQVQLKEKSDYISKLENAVQNKDVKISELRYNVNVLTAESEYLKDQNFEQDKLLNQAFYLVASKQQLKELNLLSGGLGKKRANYANIDQSKFKSVDIRGFDKLVIDSKSPKLITEKPQSSYTLTKNDDGTTTLSITDSKSFWTASPYLIIQK